METRLEQVKETARMFLYVDIAETKVPFIASHPFTNTWTVMLQDNKAVHTLENLVDLHDEEAADRWRKEMEREIKKATILRLFSLLNPPYILNFLKFAAKDMSKEDLGEVLRGFWQSIEQISLDKSVTGREIVSWFKRADKDTLMDEEDFQFFNDLPEMVTVYRGVTSYNRKKKKAFSWSVDREIAEWFANRFSTGTGEVWTMTVPKERILCYYGGREQEVIVNLYGYEGDMKIEPYIPHGEEGAESEW